MKYIILSTLLILSLSIFVNCHGNKVDKRLVFLDSEISGINFTNRITENDSINVVDFQYCYNGGGVGIGDFNNDDLPDLIFTGNQVSSSIYLNQGNLKFIDISESANFRTSTWVTGVSIVDINSDGWDDIYLNVGGANCNENCINLLFVNRGLNENGIPVFEEKASEYGLNDGNYSQQTVFFDSDGDGDLDAYIVHNGDAGFSKNNPVPKKFIPEHLKDYLLQNDYSEELGHPVFTNVSKVSNINHGGYGLGIGINDMNNDGLIDIYVTNDFITDDLLYIQKRDKDSVRSWFEEESKHYMAHTSHNAMGIDFNDINNDGLPDILVVDMLPEDSRRQKLMIGSSNYEKYLLNLKSDYNAQYVRNTLQLNNGHINSLAIKASEVGFLSNISSTDWSWSPLMIDLDNDGDKDIYISNGYVKDVADQNYINFSSNSNMFGTSEERQNNQKEYAKKLDSIHIPNYIFENIDGLRFNDVSKNWTEEIPSFSNGVAYADLDLDGDLDLIVNNINQKAFLLENTTSNDSTTKYLRFKLKGKSENRHAIGAKVFVWSNGKVQQQFQSVIKGYLSSVEPIIHFGLKTNYVDSVKVIWPDNTVTRLKKVATNQVLILNFLDGKHDYKPLGKKAEMQFEKIENIFKFYHQESHFNEFALQGLLMKQYSQFGPCLAAANLDYKEGDEVFVGGSRGIPSSIWFQNDSGEYIVKQYFDEQFEDTDAVFVDIDGDNDLDLFVTSGSSEFGKLSEFYQDRVYLNDGKGFFERSKNWEYSNQESSHLVRPSDIDNDGDIDLFVGSRILPGNYPQPPSSKILINTNGKFIEDAQPFLKNIGMVTDSTWEDVDNDGWQDLVLVGEWMPISVLKNNKGRLQKMKTTWLDEENKQIETSGWWNAIGKADFDNDGDTDFIVGNQGLNNFYEPSDNKSLYLYNGDYDKNGSPDPVLGMYSNLENGNLIPVHSRDNVINQLPILKKYFLTYNKFSDVSFEKLLGIKDLSRETLSISTFESIFAENLGNGIFKVYSLPMECQLSSINDFLIQDYNEDGFKDVLIVGNDFSSEAIYGKADAMNGMVLLGGKNGFVPSPPSESGFYVKGQSNHLIQIQNDMGKSLIITSQNKDSLLVFSFHK